MSNVSSNTRGATKRIIEADNDPLIQVSSARKKIDETQKQVIPMPSDNLVDLDQLIIYKKELLESKTLSLEEINIRRNKITGLRPGDNTRETTINTLTQKFNVITGEIENLKSEITKLEDDRGMIMNNNQQVINSQPEDSTTLRETTNEHLDNAQQMLNNINKLASAKFPNNSQGSFSESDEDGSEPLNSLRQTTETALSDTTQMIININILLKTTKDSQEPSNYNMDDSSSESDEDKIITENLNDQANSLSNSIASQAPEISKNNPSDSSSLSQSQEEETEEEETEEPIIPLLREDDTTPYEELAKLFDFYLNPQFIKPPEKKLNCVSYINTIANDIKFKNIETHDFERDIIKNKYEEILNEEPNTIDYFLYDYIKDQHLDANRLYDYLHPLNKRILIIKYLQQITNNLQNKRDIVSPKVLATLYNKIYSKLINEIYAGIQYSIFLNYLVILKLEKKEIPVFYELDIKQTNNLQQNTATEIKNIDSIDCTITLSPLSMILWVMPEIFHDFEKNIKKSRSFIEYIKKFIKKNIDTNESNKILLKLLDLKTISPGLATQMMLILCKEYKIPFLNLSEAKNKVIYDLTLNNSENNWSSHLPDFLINNNTYVYNTSDINDHSKTQFANLDNLRLIDNHPVTDFDAAHQPAHAERDGTKNRIEFNDYNYTFTLNYKRETNYIDFNRQQNNIINFLKFYINPDTRRDISKKPYILILDTISKKGINLDKQWDTSLKIKNININEVNDILNEYSVASMEKYMTTLAMAKLCGDIQYFISSLICAANINNNNNNIFMDSSKDYSAIFNVLSLKNCKYTINDYTINLNDKNIIGNLVSIRERGTNFVPKSERMINIITLMYLCIEKPNIDDNYQNLINNLSTAFECIKNNIFEILQKRISNLDSDKSNDQTILLGPMGIHTQRWGFLNKFLNNKFSDYGFPNNCLNNINNITNIKEFLSTFKSESNFIYTSMDYWIAEKIYDHITVPRNVSSTNGNTGIQSMDTTHGGGSKKNKTIKHKRNRKNKTNRNKRNKRNRKNKTIRKKRNRKNKTIKYI